MGFFSDLKEDLSQAVNELISEDEQIKKVEDAEETETEEVVTETSDAEVELSLDEMLKKIDEYQLPEEDTISAETATAAETEEKEEIVPEKSEEDAEMEKLLERMFEESPIVEEVPEPVAETKEEVIENVKENKGAEEEMDMEMGRVASDETSVITAGMVITGDISTEGSIDVVGTINGNVTALGKLNITGHITGNSKAAEIFADSAKINGEIVSEGAVKIGASSVIIGNITATSAAIAGAVKGDIDVNGPVILDASAIVMGNIKSKSVQINNGAVIEGMCSQCYAEVSPTSFFDDYKPEVRKTKVK